MVEWQPPPTPGHIIIRGRTVYQNKFIDRCASITHSKIMKQFEHLEFAMNDFIYIKFIA